MQYIHRIIFMLFVSILLSGISKIGRAQNYGEMMEQTVVYRDFMRILSGLYIDTVDVKEFTESAMIHILEKLDPFSQYISPESAMQTKDQLAGNFEGIGIEYRMYRDTLFVLPLAPESPSLKAGLQFGDKIIEVDDEKIAGVGIKGTDIMKKLRGPKDSKVKLTIVRRGVKEPMAFVVTRDKIQAYSVDAAFMPSPRVGYIKINRFAATTHTEFVEAVQKFKKIPETVIIDLRGNPGGLLYMATAVTSEFLGNKLIAYTEGRVMSRQDLLGNQQLGLLEKSRIVVLIDEKSASGSEVVAGAVQDWDRGVIIGRRSHGKGLVQEQLPLSNGALLRITVARYHTPTGRVIQSPYTEGKVEEYRKKINERYTRGEQYHKDSITLNDTIKYSTLVLGRTVYGGGGIMPDEFIPADTSTYSRYMEKLVNEGHLCHYSLGYIQDNNTRLKKGYSTIEKFNTKFEVSATMLQNLVDYAEKEGLPLNQQEFDRSLIEIKARIKANVAEVVFAPSASYQIMLPLLDKTYLRALEYAVDPQLYHKILPLKVQ